MERLTEIPKDAILFDTSVKAFSFCEEQKKIGDLWVVTKVTQGAFPELSQDMFLVNKIDQD